MEKLMGTAKKLDAVFRVLFWVVIVLTAMSAVILAVTLLGGGEGLTLVVGGITVTLPNAAVSQTDRGAALLFFAAMLAVAAAIVCGICVIRRILAPMKAGEPFSPTVAEDLRRLAWLTLVAGAVDAAFEIAATRLLGQLLTLAAPGSAALGVRYGMDLTFLLIAALLFLFSYIFRYGAALQQQSDETL